ncbi:Membrane bound O-acyl transferase, MBOAT [Ophiocordyceps camponoti-floridani]|uniref:Membrane bound O-acyl transferase, MBOAT n=1 Tax=Ophiocordyceps camponoti-floridani TaxID=2030778 RepID=A0A8H4QDJ0_9HYPO|nr:Membrane bound O-acyl transferase, MBOAT [Ophiocordyceps camponoti-floridani]
MDTVRYLGKVYEPDTLDTRFTTSSSVPYETVVDGRRRERDGKASASAKQLLTPEFCLYYLIIWTVVPWMFWIAYDVSRPSDPRYAKYERYLSPGWIPGRKVDVSDSQYHTFRQNVPFMAGFLVCHPLLRLAWNAFYRKPGTSSLASGGTPRLLERVSFDYYFAILFLVILHGVSALKVLAILHINYRIAKGLPRRFVPAATWVFNIGILFANDIYQGYHLKPMAARFAPGDSNLVRWAGWLDGHGGLMARWEVLFNISVLRLISFNMDYYWSFDGRHAESLEKQLDRASLSEKERISTGAEPGDYSFRNYVAYAVYAPLYLAGPILTFNDYVAQSRHRAASIESARTLRYGLRLLLALLAMEVVLHIDYVGAIAKASPDWGSYTPAQLSLLSLFNLHVIWLKLLLPWRLFRLWALVDGIDPPENMVRCVSNNYSTQLFWRAWHRSYNRWLIRYLYGPLIGYPMAVKGGGGRWRSLARAVLTYLTVFTFVALWHDIQMRLLIWGWLIVVFMLPEWTAVWLFPRRQWESRPVAYRLLCGVGGVMNVLLMMSANLVGFAVGLDGLQSIIRGIFRDWSGFVFLFTACSCLFVGVQVMFRLRESERKRGVTLRC